MSTSLQIISRAMRILKVLGTSEAPTNDEAQDALTALNAMLKTWSAQRLTVYAIDELGPYSLTPGTASYTIGTGGTFSTTKPYKLDNVTVRINGIDYPVDIILQSEYDSIADSTSLQARPNAVAWNNGATLATLSFYPIPDQAYSIYIGAWKPLQQWTDLTTDLAMPPEYEEALVYNLALRVAPEFGATPDQDTRLIASETKATLKRINNPSKGAYTELGVAFGRPVYDIARG